MKNKEMLRKIYYENKAINRNMQRLVNIGLIGILSGIAKEAKASDDPKAKILVKAGMVRNGHDSHNRGITFVQ